jgi:hypothetical protein
MGDCLNIQASCGNWNANHYMHGMFNGMEHMMAIMEDREPQFRSWPKDNEKHTEEATATGEVPGEREVWASAFNARYNDWYPEYNEYTTDGGSVPLDVKLQNATKRADEAVKAFRERYK